MQVFTFINLKKKRQQEKGPSDNFIILANVIAKPPLPSTTVIQVSRSSKENSEQGECFRIHLFVDTQNFFRRSNGVEHFF